MVNSLSKSFANSISEEVSSCTINFAEIGLDSAMKDGILKDIPFISTAISVYKIGKTVHERHHMAKLKSFIDEINRQTVDEHKREKYRAKFQSDEEYRNHELEYILILVERYISFDKPQMLARLYLAYLDDTITWKQFITYSEILDHMLSGDYALLQSKHSFTVYNNYECEGLLRLLSLGLLAEEANYGPVVDLGNGRMGITAESMSSVYRKEKSYCRTAVGEQMVSIVGQI